MITARRTPADAKAQLAKAMTGSLATWHGQPLTVDSLPYVTQLRADVLAWADRLTVELNRLNEEQARIEQAEDDNEATDIVYCHDDEDSRVQPCKYGHPNCATTDAGPCSDEDWHQVRADLRRKREAAGDRNRRGMIPRDFA